MRACLSICGASHGILGRLQEVRHRPWEVLPLRKVHGQFGRQRRGVLAIACFQAGTDLLVQADSLPCGHPPIHYLIIQGVPEAITRGHRPIGPGLHARRLEEPALTRPGRAPRFNGLFGQ